MNIRLPFLPVAATLLAAGLGAPLAAGVDFARDIQPIFARHCLDCHGAEKQKANLRLDERASVFRASDPAILVPGKAAASELYRRVTLPKGHEDIMPNRGQPLTRAQTALIGQWINEGAHWPEGLIPARHWAYVQPIRPALPKLRNRSWPKNGIDYFILARLEREKLAPAAEADRRRLLRRVSLDLIGLPPTPQELAAFLVDASPDAYERAVDRLLASPAYGERWARPWLDLARYADSLGFQRDNLWELWPYRDWVIRAMNADLPFDQFTIEQLAGDLLPAATLDQKIATGFNRCTAINVEAGSDQEETRVNQVFDRVNTLGTVWLGSTLECAQCHNHKYDPFSQKEYYQLFAFFNNTPKETEFANPRTTIALEFAGPYLTLPDATIERQRAELQQQLERLDQKIESTNATLLAGQPQWEQKITEELAALAQTHVLEIAEFNAGSGSAHERLPDQSILLLDDDNDAVPERDTYTVTVHSRLTGITGFKVEALTDPSLPAGGPGRGDDQRPNFVLTDFKVSTTASSGTPPRPVSFRKARASFEQKNFLAAKAIDTDPKTGWAINPQFFKDHWALFETAEPIGSAAGSTFTFTLAQNYGGGRMIGRLKLSALTGNSAANAVPAEMAALLRIPASERTDEQQRRLRDFYLSRRPELDSLRSARAKLNQNLKKLPLPRSLPMQELESARSSSILVRGNFLEKGEPVQPGVPAVLPALGDGPRNRLGLARWLANTNNPLVARVTVNRWWAEFFGHGLVSTVEDFGIKGESPTHPQLLDWLAVEFMERGWSMKKFHRLVVTSATYRQDSKAVAGMQASDDRNLLYARGPRIRMDAEMIRDNALAIAGLLSLKAGGPPVRPYQPPGLWESKVGGNPVSYELSEGEDRYRRGIYTVIKRTSPYPSFITFDAPNRTTCVVRRARSNTPLQALTLLNDPVYVEAAAALARRILREKPAATVQERIGYAFSLCTSRLPAKAEQAILLKLYQDQLRASRQDAAAVEQLLRGIVGAEGVEPAEFAAWFSVATALLNLDETITKG
jgi:hypothetical protein